MEFDPLNSTPDSLGLSEEAESSSDARLGEDHWPDLKGWRVGLVGRPGGMNRRQFGRVVQHHGGQWLDPVEASVNLLVIGADELPLPELESLVEGWALDAAATGELTVIHESELWERLGYLDTQQGVQRLYTPAMLADLLQVPISTIRRWHRRGLITAVRTVNRLPYFDFQEVTTARRLAQWLAQGESPRVIEQKLIRVAQLHPQLQRPLSQLPIIIDGGELLLRHGSGLVDPEGQRRLDFDQPDMPDIADDLQRESQPPGQPQVLDFVTRSSDRRSISASDIALFGTGANQLDFGPRTPEEFSRLAVELEEQGQIEEAIDVLRAGQLACGATAEGSFQLAELLYLSGDVTAARERYSIAVELDRGRVEAVASLGCVLAELGEVEAAIGAFHGALALHPDYPDVHYHLARLLDQVGSQEQADVHWQRFLALAAHSPWAEEARRRLQCGRVHPRLESET